MVAEQVATLRLNIGCGDFPLRGWLNVDADSNSAADQVLTVPPLPWVAESVVEIFAGHFLEHLDRIDAEDFLSECWRVLVPGGTLGIVVPDMLEVARRYVTRELAPAEYPAGRRRDLRDLDELCDMILFSTAQPSHHQWAYDLHTLERALRRAHFDIIGPIDRHRDPRLGTGQWYQCGLDARKPER